MANFGDFAGSFNELARYLRQIERHTNCLVCNTSGATPTASINIANPVTLTSPVVTAVNNASTAITDAILTGQNPTPHVTSAGVGTSIPAGFKSIAITKTSSAGTVTITLSDGSTFALTAQNELFADAASQYYTLPAYTIATADAATWKWHGIQ